jgi:hypothetical protein
MILRRAAIAELDAGDPEATLHALTGEILKYRRAVRLLAKAVGWADAGAPFAIIPPGRYWHPRQLNARPADLCQTTPDVDGGCLRSPGRHVAT